MSKASKKKDSWSTTSSSRSSSQSSTSSNSSVWSSGNKLKSKSYSDFSSQSEDELKKSKFNSDEDTKRGSNKSLVSIDSVASSQSTTSRPASTLELHVPNKDLPLNVLQLLLSIRESEILVKNLKFKYESNQKKLKQTEVDLAVKLENEKICEEILRESIELIGLNAVVYGENHFKLAWAYINLAQVYLEIADMPKQAKKHCINAFKVQVEYVKKLTRDEEVDSIEEFESNDHMHQMILNYVYGRAGDMLENNEDSESALKKSEEYFENWKSKSKKLNFFKKLRSLIYSWQKKIYLALAKHYKKTKSHSNALAYYDKLTDLLERQKLKSKDPNDLVQHANTNSVLIEIINDKANLEKDQKNFKEAVHLFKDAVRLAESCNLVKAVINCKFNLAKLYLVIEDVSSATNAEGILNECVELFEKNFDKSEKLLTLKEELIKFYLIQERYGDCCVLLNSVIKERIVLSGPYSVKLSLNYKLLCSVYLKKNDMLNAAKFLQKSLDFEEMNYGIKDKRTLATKDTLDELKKNPAVKEKLGAVARNQKNDGKPSFQAGKKVNYFKEDLKVYGPAESATGSENASLVSKMAGLNSSRTSTSRDEDLLKNLNPLK